MAQTWADAFLLFFQKKQINRKFKKKIQNFQKKNINYALFLYMNKHKSNKKVKKYKT